MIETCFDAILADAKKKKKIPQLPESPKQRIEFLKIYFKKNETIQSIIPVYLFFKRLPDLTKKREGEFRKNVNLKIIEPNGKIVEINMDKLKEYSEIVERFISDVKHILQ
jgi:hypothetical protein